METLHSFPDRQLLLTLADRYSELDVASVETCLAFLNTMADVQAAFEKHFLRYGLSLGKFTLVMQLFNADDRGLTPSECADRAGVTRATITGLLDGLERSGWIVRKPHEHDRRRLTVHLTEKGRHSVDQMLPDHFCRTTKSMANLSDREKQTLIELLSKVRAGTPAVSNP